MHAWTVKGSEVVNKVRSVTGAYLVDLSVFSFRKVKCRDQQEAGWGKDVGFGDSSGVALRNKWSVAGRSRVRSVI